MKDFKAKAGRHSRPSANADAMRSMIHLALSVHAPGSTAINRLRVAMDAFGHVVNFDVWIVAKVEFDSNNQPTLADPQVGGRVSEIDAELRCWSSRLRDPAPTFQPLRKMLHGLGRPPFAKPQIFSWSDSRDPAVISVWNATPRVDSLNATRPANEHVPRINTWISLHRFGEGLPAFSPRDRKMLSVLHEQTAWTLRPAESPSEISPNA